MIVHPNQIMQVQMVELMWVGVGSVQRHLVMMQVPQVLEVLIVLEKLMLTLE